MTRKTRVKKLSARTVLWLSFLLFGLNLLFSSIGKSAASPKSILNFDSRGMKLQRELMAEKLGPVWAMAFLPTGEILMTVKTGQLRLFDPATKKTSDVSGAPKIAVHGQGGLLDVAVAPDFLSSKKIYLSYSKEVGHDAFTTALGFGTLDGHKLKDFKEIFVAKGQTSKDEHFGGRVIVESPTSIWLSVGERGERDNAQDLNLHLGKILHLDGAGRAHPDNPFPNKKNVQPEIYSYGHRNPQGLAFNSFTHELWEQEHGPRGGDEINIIRKGSNYGWPKATFGREYFGPKIGREHVDGMEDPIHHWTPSIAPCGFVIYDGEALPGWRGLALSGSLVLTHLNLVEIKNGKSVAEERLFESDKRRVREVEQGPKGEVWYSTDDGALFRIQRAPG